MAIILEKRTLCDGTDEMIIEAPDLAAKAEPGQFVIVRVRVSSEDGDRGS